ncbi:hypothetical protein LC724_37845 [Blautia sp. RD014234]|nr:hypothetical protein [Blautia parvula]
MTAGIFFGSYVLAMFRSNRRFKKMNIREMMYLDRQNEELKNGNKSGKQWMFLSPYSRFYCLAGCCTLGILINGMYIP